MKGTRNRKNRKLSIEKTNGNPDFAFANIRGSKNFPGVHSGGKSQKKTKLKPLNVATWNVRTMLEDERRRSALIAKELEAHNIDIAALQETRREKTGIFDEKGYTFYYIGIDKPEGPRNAGVAFAIKKEISTKLADVPKGITERLMTFRMPIGKERFLTLINVYAPTMTYPDEDKDAFYRLLTTTIDKVPTADKLIVLGDFNARVGKDFSTYDGVMGKHGKGNKNSNGDLLLSLCTEKELCITNTFFHQPDKNFFSWMHPRSKRWHLLDYVLTRRADLSDTLCTKALRGPECSTDHYLIRTQVRVKPQLKRRITPPGISKRLNTTTLSDDIQKAKLESAITKALTVPNQPTGIEERWAHLKEATHKAASEALGKPTKKSKDWFDDNDEQIQKLLDQKNKDHKACLKDQNDHTKANLSKSKADLQRELRRMKDEWWNKKAEELQAMADRHDTHGLFQSLRTIYGPKTNAVAPIKSTDGMTLHTDMEEIKERWKDHFETLLNQKGSADPNACLQLRQRPPRNELTVPITGEELDKAVKETKSGKAPGLDGIPADIYKYGGIEQKDQLLSLYNACLEKGALPQDFKDALIVTVYKKKGDRSDCGNHRGISLLSIAGKILAKIILGRIQDISENVLPESQCGFRANRSTIDMIFTLRQLQEKSKEQHRPLYIVFVDFSKAFDTVDRETLWKVLKIYGCPDDLIKLVREFHDGMNGRVSVGGDISDLFEIKHGVKQGCVLAPTLFALYLAAVLDTMSINLDAGVYIKTRMDGGGLFNLSRLKSEKHSRKVCIRELLYADDSALVSNSLEEVQEITNKFAEAAKLFGLRINVSKTEFLFQPAPDGQYPTHPTVTVDGTPLKEATVFTYLGSTVSNNALADVEVERRIQAANKSFGALHKRLWSRHDVKMVTKVKVYNAAVIPSLLYGTEALTLYERHIKQLTAVQLGHLRRLLGISWQDRVPNTEVLQAAKTESVEAKITAAQLRWAGHVRRMPACRMPQQVMYGELRKGRRNRGGQRLRYKDTLKRSMKKCDLDPDTWEDLAKDRTQWRAAVYNSKSAVEEKRLAAYQKAHERRHSEPLTTTFQCPECTKLCRSNAGLAAHRRACSRTHTQEAPATMPLSTFSCPHCRMVFVTQHMLYSHLRTHHRNAVSWC